MRRDSLSGRGRLVAFGMTASVTLARAAEAPVARLPLPRSSIAVPARWSIWSTNRRTGAAAGDGRVIHRDTALITSGLSDGDKVVTLGVQKLEAGLKVRTIELR